MHDKLAKTGNELHITKTSSLISVMQAYQLRSFALHGAGLPHEVHVKTCAQIRSQYFTGFAFVHNFLTGAVFLKSKLYQYLQRPSQEKMVQKLYFLLAN